MKKLARSGYGNTFLTFSKSEGVERSIRELRRVFGEHIVQFPIKGGKTIGKALVYIIGLSESVNDVKDDGRLDDDP